MAGLHKSFRGGFMPKRRVKRHSVTQPVNESYRLIPLTQGQNAIVDAEDWEELSRWNWRACWSKNTKSFYAYRAKNIPMHVYIMRGQNHRVDHINHDTLDNRKKNLRRCTLSQNKVNSGPQRNSTSGFKGVYSDGDKWMAQIRKGRKLHYLGSFKDIREAALIYNAKAKELHGEFAFLNPII
jgi:hypothetical protein